MVTCGVMKLTKLLKLFVDRQNEEITSIPPARDSPKNILNILNDDCLQAIFSKLDRNCDLLAAAEVCTRFQTNAKISFTSVNIIFKPKPWYVRSESNRFMKIFGPRIKSIKFDRCDAKLNLVSKYCGNTLNMLRLHGKGNKFYKLSSPFAALKQLHLDNVSIEHFDSKAMFPELEILELTRVKNLNWMANAFPKLKHVSLAKCDLSDDAFIEFQKCNPQLQSLDLYRYRKLSFAVFDGIDTRLPNIHAISFKVGKMGESIRQLGNFRYLRKLILLNSYHINSHVMESLFLAWVINNQPIENLIIDYVNVELSTHLQRLKKIKLLSIHESSAHIAIDIAIKLPALKFLYFEMDTERAPISDILVKLLPHCKSLTDLRLYSKRKINLDEYNLIVGLALRRVKVTIYFDSFSFFNEISDKQNEWVSLKVL